MYLQSLKQVKETSKPLPKRRNAFDNYRKSYSNHSQSLHDVKQARIRVFSDSYYSRICLRLRENPYSGIFYTALKTVDQFENFLR